MKRTIWLELILVALAGLWVFQQKFGWEILDPFYYDWMLIRGSDVNIDLLVWLFYLQSPWTFPLGMVSGYAHPLGLSIVSTTSLALFAFPFKALGNLLGWQQFQYFGIWILLSCLLQGVCGWYILKRLGIRDAVTRVMGAGFFLLAPCFLDRRFHITLFGQWVILLGIILYLESRAREEPLWGLWFAQAALSVLVHPYFLVFSLGLSLAAWWPPGGWKKLPGLIFRFGGLLGGVLALLWATGFFHTAKGEGRAVGFGYYSANLNTFFNAQGNTTFPLDLPLATEGQYEGFAYLGLGGLVGLLLLLVFFFLSPDFRKSLVKKVSGHLPLMVVASLFFLYALSNQVSCFASSLEIPLPPALLDALALFRGSGRFVWLPFYLLLGLILWGIRKLQERYSPVAYLLLLLLPLQLWDTWPQLRYEYRKDPYTGGPFNPVLVQKAIGASGLVITYPPFDRNLNYPDDNMDLLLLSVQENKPITTGWFPRLDQVRETPFQDSIRRAFADRSFEDFPDALWIIPPKELVHLPPADSLKSLRVLFHRDYGFGFGPELEIPEAFLSSEEVDTSSGRVVHLTDLIEEKNWAYLLVSVRDEASYHMDERVRAYFRDLGSTTIDSVGYRIPWVAAFGHEGLLLEELGSRYEGAKASLRLSKVEEVRLVRLESGGKDSGDFSLIQVDEKNLSPQGRGLNVLLLDEDLELLEIFHFDTFLSSFQYVKAEN